MFSTVFGTDVNVSDSEMQETAEEMEEAEAAEAAEDSYYYEEPEVNHAVHSNMPDHTVTNLFLLFSFLFVCFHWQQQEIIDVFAIAMQEAKALSPTFEAMFVPLDVPQWVTFYDLEQEAEYYYNPATNESQWERPEDEQPPVRLWQSTWQPMFDIQSHKWFFYNVNTGESRFELPDGEDQGEVETAWETVETLKTVVEETGTPVTDTHLGMEGESAAFIGKMKHIAEAQIDEAEKNGKHCASWIEVVDPVSKKTAYYNVDKHAIQFKQPKGWVAMMSAKFTKRRLGSISKTYRTHSIGMLDGVRMRERTETEYSNRSTSARSSMGSRSRTSSRRMSLVVKNSRELYRQESDQ